MAVFPASASRSSRAYPPRSYRAVIGSLAKVWRVFPLDEPQALQSFGSVGEQALPQCFQLTVWNLYKGHGGAAFWRDFSQLLRGASLLMTQEVLLDATMRSHLSQASARSVHAAAYRRADRLRDGVMTVCQASPQAPPQRLLSPRCEPLFRTPKSALLTEYALAGSAEPLRALNLHASLFRTPSQARLEMRRWMECVARVRGPLVVAGDFNTFSRAHFLWISRELSRWGLRHVPVIPEPRSRRHALDQIYVRGLRVRAARVLTDVRSSDHFPLVCEVSVGNTP